MGLTQTKKVTVLVYGKSDIGMVREENQDSFRIEIPETAEELEERGRLLVLADGMGGLAHGGQASQIAVEQVAKLYFELEGEPPTALVHAVERANSEVFQETQNLPGNQPMGSTMTAMAFLGDRAIIAHVGDSRAYRISDESGLVQLTRDHTLVQELADRGEIEPDSLHYLLNRNVLTRGLGLQDEIEVDLVPVGELQVGDTFLLCSDGLYDVVADSEVESHVLSYGNAIEDLVHYLLELARSRGAPDNVTIVVARVEPEGAPSRNADAIAGSSTDELETTAPQGSGSLLTPLTYFLAFALGAILTLLLQRGSGEAVGTDIDEAMRQLRENSALEAYEGREMLLEELDKLREWRRGG